jgi:hypothetical protein
MVNYLNIRNIWDIIKKWYISQFDENTKDLTLWSKIDKKNNFVINIILNFVCESR